MTEHPDGPHRLIDTFDGLLLDLDGVVYVGSVPVSGAVESLRSAADVGLHLGFVTNNAARSAASVAEQLRSFGLPCQTSQVVTSAQLAADWLAARFPQGAAVLAVGGPGLISAVQDVGLDPVSRAAQQPVAVVQGFGPDVGWRQLAQASIALAEDIPWVATNVDLTVPTPAGRALGNGALVAALTAATGRSPDAVTGKPAGEVFTAAASRWKLRRPLVVGDRLDTDIEGAHAAGLPSLLVLTGVTAAADLLTAPPPHRPDFIGEDLGVLLRAYPPVTVGPSAVSVNGWRATTVSGRLTITGEGDRQDAVRAACRAAWRAWDAGEPLDVSAAREEISRAAGH
ncbi:MAG TPA: HAD-IIA family hydrolase [Actinomycetes bacterium]|nr:HAD-IIA family hydrolase [Actinomycetes bacterium]